jgi:protein-L-isoaspartate(D-aspartate) O-methyltransferase
MSAASDQMVSQQVRTWEVLDPLTLATLRTVPREHFVPDAWRNYGFAEFAIPLPHGKRMLMPMVAGRLLQAVAAREGEQALEIGTGSGYVSACLARMGASVRSQELHADIAEQARLNLHSAGVHGVRVETADGTLLDETARYDCIVLTASVPVIDERYQRALKGGGRLFVVHGTGAAGTMMDAVLITRTDSGFDTQFLFQTALERLEHVAVPAAFRF